MKLLLINPKFPESFWSFKWAVENVMPREIRTINPPLGLATLAALSPPDWSIEIIDENIESIPVSPDSDIIGICGMGVQFQRQKELLNFYKNQGYYVVAGGSYASLCPEYYNDIANTVIAGEAEYIWKRFCDDFVNGNPLEIYQESGEVNLHDSPVPRFDLLKINKYQAVSLQFSRGCPFRCEFCDIIVMFGRKPRTKTMEQVGRELDELRKLNIKNVLFVDDNLIGNKPLAKDLMKFLRGYQQNHRYNFLFGTEASLNLAQDKELLRLFHDANFGWVFIGIESPDEDSLKETLKFQNTRADILASVREIYSYGIEVLAGFIIGFDNDTPKTFDLQYNFIMNSGIQAAMIGLLTAIPKTPLYERLEKDGRLRLDASGTDNTKLGTNIVPKQLSYDNMVSGYRDLYYKLLDDKNIAKKISIKTKFLTNPIFTNTYSRLSQFKSFINFIFKGIIPGGYKRIYHFLKTLPYTNPGQLPLVIQDWVIGVAMRDYIDRHFIQEHETSHSLTANYLKLFEHAFKMHLSKGNLELSVNRFKNAASNFSISIKGLLDSDFYSSAADHLERILSNTSSSITLKIEIMNDNNQIYLHRLLNRLSKYGDRIYIKLDYRLRKVIRIDSSIFNLVLDN